jgi:hypothetical protein
VKAEDAATLVGFLKSAFPSMTDDQMRLYEANLAYEDGRVASRAILDGIKEWKFCPKYAEIMERIRMFARAEASTVPRPARERAVPPPFWVKRWIVARYIADPPDLRVFREEEGECPEGYVPEEGWMPEGAWVEEAELLTPEQITKATASALGVGGQP